MAEIVITLLFPEEDEEMEGIMRITRKRLRDESDPFALPESQFRSLYR